MEFVVEPVVSELFKGLFKILESKEVQDFARNLVGVDSELKELGEKVQMVENLLGNAEDKQLTDKRVKEWLDNLQDWAFDAEDLLDEFAYHASRRKLKAEHQASSSKVMSCLRASFPSPFHMGSKIKDITCRLEQLQQKRSAEHEMQVVSGGTSSNVAAPQRPEETSSVPPEQVVHGRVEDEAKLLDRVKSAQPSGANFRVIAIVGMGGIGKTTIARKIYNHMQVLEDFKFDKKAWVCVSNNFDVLTISKAILESIDSSPSIPNHLNEVQLKLRDTVNQKKFLLVLDDVWSDDYGQWEILKAPFKAGAPGSTMIITTRLENVASAARSFVTYPLKPISDDHCWQLFQEHAFGDGSMAEAHEIHHSIREGLIQRCRGLPLAAKTLGGLLHSKPWDSWEKILNSNIWSTSDKSDQILPALRLSYHYLPSNLKRCFAYCAVFPKDYEFKENELVLLWMAEGIVQSSDKQFDKAGEYFRGLCSRSLLQKSSSHSSNYVMHDLIHDLAESVFKEFSFRSEKAIIELPQNIKRMRHFSYISDRFNGEKKFIGLEKLKSLRTFLPVFMRPHHFFDNHFISAMVIFYLLPKLKKLRVLSLEKSTITYLPDSIGGLMHLRYLNFSYTMIKSLPESTSQLLNLQTLLLKGCSRLVNLPFNMRYLINLYHLDISGHNSLKEMPSRMKELKNLRVLSNFIVGKESSLNLEDLKSLSSLQG
ncbi:putative disease resistance RPP13-like protein 1 [Pistacia vera]|uniref:putative disease resistance RPP13-like protein 1 n=1 Tax=Pistacia vera TaxID=55513 RepID=UPI001262C84F|nr:putative disease resistance RPP13-like protein 1 [Pistacia vera]